ncbi:MAG: hypothetical protein JNJ57_02150 [Saprospiraceae bacterium]|nr:hypothetical protein [Saprospiraceae bacterium]
MNPKVFFTWLTVVTLATSAALFIACHFLPQAQPHVGFAIATNILFVLICVGLYFAGVSALRGNNKYAFTNLVSASVFGKMVLALLLLFVYQKTMKPANEWFVGIFLFCYMVYTGFEVWFMTRLAKRS